MASTNPGNFANRPTEEVKAIASMGGKASHGGSHGGSHSNDEAETKESHAASGRNADGTFTKGSEAAKEAGHLGGLHSHQNDGGQDDSADTDTTTHSGAAGRNPDGTFTKGSEAAKEAGHRGGST